MTVVFDSNIWISLTLNKQLDFLSYLSENGFVLATCVMLRSEIEMVMRRPKITKYISPEYIDKVIELHDLITLKYNLTKIIPVTADPKDDYLFALSNKSKAKYLVTGDKLLLEVKDYKKTKIITLADFKKTI